MIENLSDKTITAVKLGWKVYTQKEGLALPMAGCNAPTEAKVLLSGATPLVELGRLAPKQTGTISINPLPAPTTAGIITVFVDRPLLTVEDVRSLTDAPGGDANQYAAVMSITEIRFDDGTTWKAENN
jgi:hypothetical protein